MRNRSLVIDLAESRAAALAAVEPAIKLGETLSLTGYQESIAEARTKLSRYNGLLSEAEEARTEFERAEGELAQYSTRVLAVVAGNYGRESTAYVAAGGTMTSKRKRPIRRTAALTENTTNAA